MLKTSIMELAIEVDMIQQFVQSPSGMGVTLHFVLILKFAHCVGLLSASAVFNSSI